MMNKLIIDGTEYELNEMWGAPNSSSTPHVTVNGKMYLGQAIPATPHLYGKPKEERDWEIQKFKDGMQTATIRGNGKYSNDLYPAAEGDYPLETVLRMGNWDIIEVKRTTDSLVFEVDEITEQGKILSFVIPDEQTMLANVECAVFPNRAGVKDYPYKLSELTKKKQVRPPLGLTPQWMDVEQRLAEISEAIVRCHEANRAIPKEWMLEFDKKENWLKEHHPTSPLIKNAKPSIPILISEDRQPLYEHDKTWIVDEEMEIYLSSISQKSDEYRNETGHKYFAKEENARAFVEKNKPKEWTILSVVYSGNADYSFDLQENGRYRCDKFYDEDFDLIEDLLENKIGKTYLIKTVRRNSDGEVFSLGDKCYYGVAGEKTEFTIDAFVVAGSDLHLYAGDIPYISIDRAKKHNPLFRTFDNVDIFEGDEYWCLQSDYHVSKCLAPQDYVPKFNKKRFSTEQAAKDHILFNQHILSLNDLLSVMNDVCNHPFPNVEDAKNSPLFQGFKALAEKKLRQ